MMICNTKINKIVIKNQLSLNCSLENNPQINSTKENNGTRQYSDTLKPSFRVICETRYNNAVSTIIIAQFSTQLNVS